MTEPTPSNDFEFNPYKEQNNLVALAKKVNNVKRKIRHMSKTGKNKQQNYEYIEESEVAAVIGDALLEEGLLITPTIDTDSLRIDVSPKGTQLVTTFIVRYELMDEDTGICWPVTIDAVCQGADPGDKGAYKASTGGFKYAMLRWFQIGTGDDPEKEGKRQQRRAVIQTPKDKEGAKVAKKVAEEMKARDPAELITRTMLAEENNLISLLYRYGENKAGEMLAPDDPRTVMTGLDAYALANEVDDVKKLMRRDLPHIKQFLIDEGAESESMKKDRESSVKES
jgi:hypothetical protein